MDRAEYKIKLEEINTLAEQGDFKGAAKAADEVEWKHVKSARTLCMIGEIYEADKRYNESLQVLKYAYKRSEQSKTVLYRLAELSIRMRDFDEAKRYKREFEEVAPNDSSRFLLQYKLLRANKAPLDDQIQVLQEYKDREYTERWAYELAKLYLKNGQVEKCIDECDDMILWFSEGKYVKKAMELKMQFRPLTAVQKAKYEKGEAESSDEADTEILSGMETVEKAVNEASESEAEVEQLDSLADAKEIPIDTAGDTKRFSLGGNGSEKLQNRLADSIQAIFSGMHSGKENASENTDAENKAEEPEILPLEPEAGKAGSAVVDTQVDFPNLNTPEPKQEDELDLVINADADQMELQKDGQLDLDKLFAETSNSLAGELATGQYTMADTLEQDRKPEQLSDVEVESLTGRESDESLGLTREFHFREELAKELEKENTLKERTAIPKPEEAARNTVFKATGKVSDVPEEIFTDEAEAEDADLLPEEDTAFSLEEDHFEDEDLFRSFGEEQAIREELLADETEMRQIPESASEEALMNLSTVAPAPEEGSKSIIEHIMEEPEVFTRVPVEARALNEDEKKALSYFASIPGVDYQVTTALADIHNNCGDKTSKSGNVVIMGRQGAGKTRLAEGLILATCQHLNLKAAKSAIVVADSFNQKDPAAVVKKLSGGFLVIEAAGSLSDSAIDQLNQAMEFRTDDLIVILEDEKDDMRKMLAAHPEFAEKFSSTITVPVFTNDELVTFGKTYAKENGYKLDELATLALYTMIGDNQKDAEPVTVGSAKEMIDRAIERHRRKFRLGKNEKSADGRIVLKEKDFNF